MSFTRRSSTTLQVTRDDVGQYYCLVYKPGQMLAEGKVSMPTELVIIEASTSHAFYDLMLCESHKVIKFGLKNPLL